MGKVRIHKYDNLKGLAILLIVFGHCLYSIPGFAGVLRQGIYIFHLPIFFFVAGYFSRIHEDIVEKSVKRLIIPYIVLTIISFLFCIPSYTTGTLFFNPYGGLWFLLALFTMKILLPPLNKLKYPVIVTFIFSLLIGFFKINGEVLFTTRTFAFLPIFMLGFRFNEYKDKFNAKFSTTRIYDIITNNKILLIILFVLVGLSLLTGNYINQEMVEMAHSYAPNAILSHFSTRFIIIIIGIGTTLILNKLMTNKETFLTKFGRNSLAVYLLHILLSNLTLLAQQKNDVIATTSHPIFYILFSLLASFIITFVFSRDPITRIMNQVFDSATDVIISIVVEIKRPFENTKYYLKAKESILNFYYNYYL